MTARPACSRSTEGAVVVVGSVNRDITVRTARIPSAGETVIGRSVYYGLGGKGANQAVAAARAGTDVDLFATVGDDPEGYELLRSLSEYGVGTDLVAIAADAPTGSAHILLDDRGENRIVVVPGANATTTPERLHAVADRLYQADVLVAQGEVPQETLRALFELLLEDAPPVVLNLAPFLPLPLSGFRTVAVLVLNETETGQLLSQRAPDSLSQATAAARRLLEWVPAIVITLGADGALVASRDDGIRHIAAPPIERVVDTTGAGDALVGVLAAAVARKLPLSIAAAHAVRAATLSVGFLGAASSYPPFEID